MARIFISHSSRDNLAALAFMRWLETHGWGEDDVFLDLHDIGVGARWKDALKAANARCEAVVFLASPEALNSKECGVELRMAEDYGKQILPAIIRDVAITDPRLDGWRERQIVDLTAPGESVDIEVQHQGQKATIRLALAALESLRNRLIATGVSPASFAWPPKDRPDAPVFPGLSAFTDQDAAIFFGRDADIVRGLDKLNQLRRAGLPRVVPIQAPSGAGKSSFLMAGLWPRLVRHPDFAPLAIIRPAGGIITGKDGVAQKLARWFAQRSINRNPGDIAAAITQTTDGLAHLFAEVMAIAHREVRIGNEAAAPPSLVLAIDQAEELFAAADQAESALFLDRLAAFMAAPPPGVQPLVLLTIRADSLSPLVEAMKARDMAPAEPFVLPPMDRSAYPEIIKGPVAVANRSGRKLAMEPMLVDELVRDAAGADALPLLAFTLARLDADYGADGQLELSEYERMGGVEGSITKALNEARAKAGLAGDDESLRRLFIPQLVTWDAEADQPKRLKANTEALLGGGRSHLKPLVEALVAARLLTQDDATTEVAHEALLRQPPLSDWLAARKEALRILAEVQSSAAEYAARAGIGPRQANWLIHRGERLTYAEQILAAEDFQVALGERGKTYLQACRAAESAAATKEKRQINRARSWQNAAAIILLLGFSALAIGGWFLVSEQRVFGESKSLMLARTAEQLLVENDPRRAAVLSILSSRETAISPSTPEAHASFASAAQSLKQQVAIQHEGPVWGAAFSKDETRILTWSDDNTARLWDTATGAQVGPALQHESAVRGAAFSKDETRILTWSDDNTARIWDTATGAQVGPALQHESAVYGATFSKDETRILAWSNDKTARLWDAATGAQVGPALRHEGNVLGAAFSTDETRILTWSDDNTARLWDTATGAQVGPALQHENFVYGAVFSKDDNRILTWSWNGIARLWDAATGAQVGPALQHEAPVRGAAFSANESRILTWSDDGNAKLWDAATGAQIGPALRHEGPVWGAAFSKDETLILTWSWDGTARLWDAATGNQAEPALQHEGVVWGAAFSKDESRILTWSDYTARLWDAATGAQVGSALQHEGTVYGAAFSKDETRILTWSDDKTARLWDSATGAEVGHAFQHEGDVLGAAFSKDETRIVTWSRDNTARLWNTADGAQVGPVLQHEGWVNGAAFSQDETRILTWSGDLFRRSGEARLWDAATSAQVGPALQHEGTVNGALFSNDETRILTWSEDNTARLWDAATGVQIGPALQHEGDVLGAAFSKDETRILTWSDDNTARLWNSAAGVQIGPDLQHEGSVYGAVFSNDETRILTWSEDNTARLWDAATGAQVGPALQHEGAVNGAAFSTDETRIVTWSDDNTARLWDVNWAMQLRATPERVQALCNSSLRGSLAKSKGGEMVPFPRLVDDKMIIAAPILRGRKGEDVCAVQKLPWWEKPLQTLIDLVGMK